jgi:osmotically-inducible protein OsmY
MSAIGRYLSNAKRGKDSGVVSIGRSMLKSATPALMAAALLAAASCASGPSLDATFADAGVDVGLKRILLTDRRHDYSDIDITVFDRRLMLTGTMRSEQGRRRVVENAWKVEGVEQVVDEVLVAEKTSFGQGVSDSRIDQALRTRLIADRSIDSVNYKFSVSGGVVYLIGIAQDAAELDRVLEMARAASGVKKVVSHVVYRTVAR